MLTLTCEQLVSQPVLLSQTETVAIPTDAEIARRVDRIRSSWTAQERIERRRAAEERFANLMDLLTGEAV